MQSMGIDHENWSNSQLTYSWKHFNKKCFLLVRSPTSWPTRATLPCDSSSPTGWTSSDSITCAVSNFSRHDRDFPSEAEKKALTSSTPRSRSSTLLIVIHPIHAVKCYLQDLHRKSTYIQTWKRKKMIRRSCRSYCSHPENMSYRPCKIDLP